MQNKITFVLSFVALALLFAISPMPIFAHVVVQPSTVGIATFQTFTMAVPTERDIPTVGLKLLIPSGLHEVTPTVKAGWTITVTKNDSGVTEIDWTDGQIPPEQRDEFSFNAQVPSDPTTITWKAYQTYSDGSVVSWDMNPSKIQKGEEGTPFSTTKVINDLQPTPPMGQMNSQKTNISLVLSIVAIVIASIAVSVARRKAHVVKTKPRKRKKRSFRR